MEIFNNLIRILYFRQKNNLALYCQLTGVYNYNWLKIVASKRFANSEIYITMIDFNGLKKLNDTQGHIAGDKSLRSLARKLKIIFNSKNSFVCRYGGDEFVVLTKYNPSFSLECISSNFSYGTYHKKKNEDFLLALEKADKIMYRMKNNLYKRRNIDGTINH